MSEFGVTNFEQNRLSEIEVSTICQKYKVFLAHALPDGMVVDTSLLYDIDDKSFENIGKRIFQQAIPNLACSSFAKGDKMNRFQNRMQGVLVLGGHIVYANPIDGMSWPDTQFQDLNELDINELKESIHQAICAKTRMNEIHVDTRNGKVIPYIDLDKVIHTAKFCFPTEKAKTIETLQRVRDFAVSLNCQHIGVYLGSIRKR